MLAAHSPLNTYTQTRVWASGVPHSLTNNSNVQIIIIIRQNHFSTSRKKKPGSVLKKTKTNLCSVYSNHAIIQSMHTVNIFCSSLFKARVASCILKHKFRIWENIKSKGANPLVVNGFGSSLLIMDSPHKSCEVTSEIKKKQKWSSGESQEFLCLSKPALGCLPYLLIIYVVPVNVLSIA